MLKITCLSLSIALGMSLGVASSFASSNTVKNTITISSESYETAHLKKKKRNHRHCHTGIRNHKLIKNVSQTPSLAIASRS